MVWLMVAISLFAALSFVVSENMRSGDPQMVSQEMAKNHASEILQYSSGVRRAVQAIKIDGVDDTMISFETQLNSGYQNPGCPTDSCKVFSPTGGGLSYVKPSEDWLASEHSAKDHYGTWLVTGSACIAGVGSGGTDCESDADSNTEELVLILPYVRKPVCEELNKKAGFNLPDGVPLAEGNSAWHSNPALARFTGSYLNESQIGDVAAGYRDVRMGCFEGSGSNTPAAGTYHYFEVLLAR